LPIGQSAASSYSRREFELLLLRRRSSECLGSALGREGDLAAEPSPETAEQSAPAPTAHLTRPLREQGANLCGVPEGVCDRFPGSHGMSRDQPAIDDCAEHGGGWSVGGVELGEPSDGRAILEAKHPDLNRFGMDHLGLLSLPVH
jgi:hypothetical protein